MSEPVVDRLIKEIEVGVEDARSDFPEVGDGDLYHEIMASTVQGHSLAVQNAVRRHFGFDELKVR